MLYAIAFILALAITAQAQTETKSYPALTSTNINEFQLNGQATVLNPNGDSTFRLTSSGPGQGGSIYLKESIALTGPNGFKASFSTVFSFSMPSPGGIGDEDGAGADGLVFVVNAVSNTVGTAGGGMGYLGVTNSVGIEFDTYNNGEVSGNHIGIDLNGDINSVQNAHYATRMNSGTIFYAWVEFNGDTQVLEVRISTDSTRPTNAFLSRVVDLVSALGSSDVYVGFSAATGSGYNVHQIHTWVFTNSYTIISQCGNAILETGEVCDGGPCCLSDCSGYISSGTVCRASTGPCDVEEVCTGSSQSCPAQGFASSSVTCRASAGDCDSAEQCTGSSADCPVDSFLSSSVTCRASAGDCDIDEQCTGSSASCPSNSFQSSAVTCRASAGVCDVVEQCTGSSATCPTDAFQVGTTCRASTGICDVAETCSGSSASCPSNSFASNTVVCRDSIGPCDPAEKCSGFTSTCPADVLGNFETDCIGLNFVIPGQSTSFLNYDVISFNGLIAERGNIEGRVAVKNNINVGDGWSVGFSTGKSANDQQLAYAVVAGGNVNWISGEIYPHFEAYPNGPQWTENMFVGGTFNGASYLADRVTGNCTTAGCIATEFDDVQACYGAYQNSFAALSDNVAKVIQWSGLTIYCNNANSLNYIVSITPAEMSMYTYVVLDGCNADARWIVNVPTSNDVLLTGVSIPAPPEAVVYNIIGSGRTITINGIYVEGSILAPYNTLYQNGGIVKGRVIVGDITKSLNFDKAGCFVPNANIPL